MGRRLTDTEVLGTSFVDTVTDLIRIMRPFVTYLNSIVMPDEQEDGEEDSDGSVDDEGEEAE